MENITLGQIYSILLFLGGFIGAVILIMQYVKKALDKVIKPYQDSNNAKIDDLSKKVDEKIACLEKEIHEVGSDGCKNYLCQFLANIETGQKMQEIEIQRAHDAMDNYTNKYHANSYIHDKWEKLMERESKK